MKFSRFLIILFVAIFSLLSDSLGQQTYSEIPSAGKTTIFSDNFDNNSNSWLLDNLWVKGKVEGGQYQVTCKNYQKSTGLSYVKISVDQAKDYEIEASIKCIKGTGGLIFGVNSKYDHYRVELAGNKLIIARNTLSTGKIDILSSSPITTAATSGTFSKITVRKYKGEFFIYLNESLIGRFDIIKPDGDQVGFNVGLNSEIIADYLNVSYIQDKPLLAVADNVKVKDTITVAEQQRELTTPKQNQILPGETEIMWKSPSSVKTIYDKYSARVTALVKSPSELSSVIFYVNGTPKGEAERRSVAGETGSYNIEKTVNFDPGENVVYFTVTNEKNESKKSEERLFTIPEATKPVVTWGVPEISNVIVDNERLNIEVCVLSPSELKSIKVLVNGEQQGADNVFKYTTTENCNVKWQYTVFLREGTDNSIVVIADNIAGSNPSDTRIVRYSKTIAQKRLALVLGNSNYNNKTPLKNPIQDANLMEATLKGLGFDVIKRLDLNLQGMRDAVREFSQKMKEYNVALFYYAGHGVQVDGKNFLIPVDATLNTKDDCDFEAYAITNVLEQFEKNPKNINIAILDACRSNPFQSWVRGEAGGFTPLTNTTGTFVSFATAPGKTAADGSTGNGLFTEELVKQMNIPQPISSVFLNTRMNVWERSNKTQRPQEWNDLNGEFYFKK